MFDDGVCTSRGFCVKQPCGGLLRAPAATRRSVSELSTASSEAWAEYLVHHMRD